MGFIVIVLIISFLCDSIFSNFLAFSLINPSIFKTICTLVSLVSVYPYFNNNRKYLIIIIIFWLLFDIVYSSTFLFITFIFVIIYFINKVVDLYLPYNMININIISVLSIILYHLISFFILNLVNYNTYSLSILLKCIYTSILGTVLYTTILFFILKFFEKKGVLKKVK